MVRNPLLMMPVAKVSPPGVAPMPEYEPVSVSVGRLLGAGGAGRDGVSDEAEMGWNDMRELRYIPTLTKEAGGGLCRCPDDGEST